MNYATWKLNFTNPEYGTGPEEKIAQLGFGAEAGMTQGSVESGGTVLGYVTEPQDETELTTWDFTNITQAEALEFALTVNPEAYLLPDGKITVPMTTPGE